MDSLYSPYLNWIDSQQSILLQRVKEWVAINTFSWNVKGLAQFLHELQLAFHVLRGESFSLDLSEPSILNGEGFFQSQSLGQALVIRKRPQAPIQVLLGAHMDTVYSPSHSFQYIEEQGVDKIKGPGVADMKGGIAILLTVLEAFERFPFASQIGWEVLLTPDEEIGSPGSASLYEAAAHRHQVGLIFEPSFSDGAFASQRKGSATYSVVFRGKAAHVGRDFAKGKSAVFALAGFIHELKTLSNNSDLTINVADVEGKGPVNIVPPLAHCRINLRSSSSISLEKASQKLLQFAQEFEKDGIQIQIVQDSFRPPKPFDDKTQVLFRTYANCAEELNIPFQIRPTGGVCDGNILAGAGLPTLDTVGAIGGNLHTPDEYLFIPSLVERAKLATLFLFKLATQEMIS